jgi:hypothetical protein
VGLSWLWLYGSWIYNYLCNQCLSPLKLWVRISLMARCTHTTLCDKVCQWLVTGRWFSPVSFTNKTDRHDITETLWKVVLNSTTLTPHTIEQCVHFQMWSYCDVSPNVPKSSLTPNVLYKKYIRFSSYLKSRSASPW